MSEPVETDTLERARRPLLETYDNALKSNGGWMGLVDRAQSERGRIDRFLQARAIIEAITPEHIRETAERFLQSDAGLEVLVLPQPDEPSPD